MFDPPWRSRAIATLTQESIPPLKSATAFLGSVPLTTSTAPPRIVSFISFKSLASFTSSNSLGRRVPDELVQLQAQPYR